MREKPSAEMSSLISREQAENDFRKALNLFVGRGRRYSVDQLAKGSGVPRRVIDCFRGYELGHPDYRQLHFGHMLSVAAFLGADFTNEWLPLAGQGAFDLPDDEPDPGELAAESAEGTASVVRAALNGKFDDHERDQLKVVGRQKIAHGMQLVALGRAA